MTARTVSVKLTAEVGSYITGLRNAAAATRDLTSSTLTTAAKNKQAFTQVGIVAAGIGTAAAAGVAAAVGSFAQFDAAMSGVQAATHETAGAMNSLREAALEAGARTAFSATEAAEGIEALAKAGVSTQAILNGGLNGALDLAAAGSLGVGEAAEIAATAMTQFKLSGDQVPHIADLLAAAAGKAQGEVSDMGQALKQAGLVASQVGLSVDETTTALAAFASAGLLGSDAGTSLKTMLQRLTPTSNEAADSMAALGFSAYDQQGNFIGLSALADEMQTSFAGLTTEQRNLQMATIFGSDAVRAASVLYEQGAAGIGSWTEKVNDAGYAQETAAIKLDNLKGDIEAFTGSLETALIKTGEAGDGFARGAVQAATGVVNAYSGLPDVAQQATLGIGGFIAVAGAASGSFLVLAPRIAETRDALRTLSTEMPRTTGAMQNLGKAASIAAILAGTAFAVDQLSHALAGSPPGVNALTDSLADFLRTGRTSGDLAKIVGKDFADLGESLELASKNRALEFANPFGESDQLIVKAREEVEALDMALTGLVTSGHAEDAQRAFEDMAESVGISAEELAKRFPGYAEALRGLSAESKLAADGAGTVAAAQGDVTEAMELSKEAAEAAADALQKLAEADAEFVNPMGAYEAARSALEAASKSDAEAQVAVANEAVDAKIKAAQREYDARLAVARDTKGISDAVIQRIEDERDATIDALGKQKTSWEDYATGVKVSVAAYLTELEKQVEAQTGWERNMLLLSGRVSAGVLKELEDMGQDGAPLVAELVNASDGELARLEGLFRERSSQATTAFADGLTRAQPVLAEVARIAGRKTAEALAQKLAEGGTTVAAIMRRYGIAIDGGVEAPIKRSVTATDTLIRKLSDLNGRKVTVTIIEETVRAAQRDGVGAGLTRADGGWVTGPGGPRDDMVHVAASNGEFVVNAAAASANAGLLEALNRGSRFADGGWVGGVPMHGAGASGSSGGGPRSFIEGGLTLVGGSREERTDALHQLRDEAFRYGWIG